MSKDQAARIAENHYGEYVADYQEYRKRLARSIRRYGDKRAKEERERCVQAVWDECNTRPQNAARRNSCGRILDAIRKGKA